MQEILYYIYYVVGFFLLQEGANFMHFKPSAYINDGMKVRTNGSLYT